MSKPATQNDLALVMFVITFISVFFFVDIVRELRSMRDQLRSVQPMHAVVSDGGSGGGRR